MKFLIILFFFINFSTLAQFSLKGKIIDSDTKSPLPNTNISIVSKIFFGTYTNANGEFELTSVHKTDTLKISFIGYETAIISIQEIYVQEPDVYYTFQLTKAIIPSQTILIEATVAKKGITPLAFEKITRKDIEDNYTVQDIPKYLSDLPSTTFYSESGNAIGYNYLSIRGFDQRRITVSINGIPQNDPEDHNVYWLDFPDLLQSTELIQVQRGAGSGVFGYPAIGGSINLITSTFSNRAKLQLSAAYGSYNTKKYSASFSSGLIDSKYSVYANLGQILSSGYKEKTWVNFKNYFLSAVRYDKKFTIQINIFGGPIEDGLGYTGVTKFAVKNKELRKKNYSYWEADEKEYTFVVPRRPEEMENFFQPHFELLNEWQINDITKFNSALFVVLGDGFFDFDASWADTSYLRLTQENGFMPAQNPGNALIRAKVENEQYGWIPRFSLNHNHGVLFFGGELRFHNSVHWGSVNYGENLPVGITKDYKYYYYKGSKDIASIFVNESYTLNENLNFLAELQLAYHNYRLFDEKYVGTDFSISNVFFNPRLGVNFKPVTNLNFYVSFAHVSREPRLKEYYDAAESSGGAIPQFEQNPDGSFDYDNPLVKPETMNDFEFGAAISGEKFSATINFFYMIFTDEIVKNGQLDRFGQPVTGNVDRTQHIGLELSGLIKFLNNKFELFANATTSKNTIEEGKDFLDADNFILLNGNRISGFPNFLANIGISFKEKGFYMRWNAKFVDRFFSDNYDDNLSDYLIMFPDFVTYTDNVNDAYFVSDIYTSYEFQFVDALTPWKIYLQLNNIFDNLYSTYAIGKEFFPAAERNFLAGIQVGL